MHSILAQRKRNEKDSREIVNHQAHTSLVVHFVKRHRDDDDDAEGRR